MNYDQDHNVIQPWAEFYADEDVKHGILKSLRTTCRQLHSSCQEIFLNTFVKYAGFGLTIDQLAVISKLPSNFKGAPINIYVSPTRPPVPSEQLPPPSSAAAAVNRFADLRGLHFYGEEHFDSQLYFHRFINDLTLRNLSMIKFFEIDIDAHDVIAAISPQPRLTNLRFESVNLSTGSWEQIFVACGLLSVRYFKLKDGQRKVGRCSGQMMATNPLGCVFLTTKTLTDLS